jgi:hypothetical protein
MKGELSMISSKLDNIEKNTNKPIVENESENEDVVEDGFTVISEQ